jgi:endonuclease-8
MPEGHTLHRLAAAYGAAFGGESVHVSSPQGPFAPAAMRLDGHTLSRTEAHGKNLFLGFEGVGWIHIHLGLYGKVRFGEGPAPAPFGQIRLRIATDSHYADLRGPTTCALISSFDKKDVQHRLGPDPLRVQDTGEAAWQRVSRSSTTIAALLMDQKVLPGRALTRAEWDALWDDLVALMAAGVRDGWIDTVRPEHTPRAMGRAARQDAHGGEVYVYRRAHQPCLVCGSPVRTETHADRNLFWCPGCQPQR